MSAERLLNNNPQPVDVEDCKKILTVAYIGDLAAFETGAHAPETARISGTEVRRHSVVKELALRQGNVQQQQEDETK